MCSAAAKLDSNDWIGLALLCAGMRLKLPSRALEPMMHAFDVVAGKVEEPF